MEVNEDGFLEELLSQGRETIEANPTEVLSDFFTTSWGFDSFDEGMLMIPPPLPLMPPPPFEPFSSPIRPNLDCSFNDLYSPFDVKFTTPPDLVDDFGAYQSHGDFSMPVVEDEDQPAECKVEMVQLQPMEVPSLTMEVCMDKKKKKRKLEGQPSKNLMAERRRRKRLNDRLSMLRSVVPKISKMDRTSILGDTIDYMKELKERISNLQEEIDANSSELNEGSLLKDLKPNEFDVERRNVDTRIEICCTSKPGLLLSTMTTLEALGLEIQQCVISCFNDFSLQASCSEELEQRTQVTSEEIKQALFRNAGYGGRCM